MIPSRFYAAIFAQENAQRGVGRGGAQGEPVFFFLAGGFSLFTKNVCIQLKQVQSRWMSPFCQVQQGPGQFPFPPHHRVASRDHSLTKSGPDCLHISRTLTLPKSSGHI